MGRLYHFRVWLGFHAIVLAERILPADLRSINRTVFKLGTQAAHDAMDALVLQRSERGHAVVAAEEVNAGDFIRLDENGSARKA